MVGYATPVYTMVDGSTLFVDDDGTGYLIYTSLSEDHKVSIEKLTPDYLNTTGENYGLFPDRYVEGAILFKRKGLYYVGYGSCCCFCRGGSGAGFFSSPSIKGPWKRLGYDKNCLNGLELCGTYADRSCDSLIIPAQGIGLSVIPSNTGENYYIWQGERWLSALGNPPGCPDECRPTTGICAGPDYYVKGHGYTYWYPLEFDSTGDVLPFASFVFSFDLDI